MAVKTTAELAAAHDVVVRVIRTIPDAALDWQSDGEDWSLRSVISHLAHANDFYVTIVDEARARNFGSVRLHPDMAGLQHMATTDAAIAQSSTAAAALACFERTYEHLLAVLEDITSEELDRPFVLSYTWQPEVEPVTTTLRERVIETATSHLREHQAQVLETLTRWQITQKAGQGIEARIIVFRPAEFHDLESLCRLYVAFHEFHVRGVPDRLESLGDPANFDCTELMANLAKLLENPEARIFVALDNEQLVGLAEVYLRTEESDGPRRPCRYGYLQSLMVQDGWRQQGIGQRLLKMAEAWSATHGASEIRLETWEFPAGPHAFYGRCGYHTLRRTLIRHLEQRENVLDTEA
ncbi:MAG TPA: GNAT family N-acetyltransferase [Herpetosiphonaceae bacterium]|nr:GNAT family N-acetyltransferase [Herpetosiphonaceae bacterium]